MTLANIRPRFLIVGNLALCALNSFVAVKHVASVGPLGAYIAVSTAASLLSAYAALLAYRAMRVHQRVALVVDLFQREQCPDCRNTLFYPGPMGGASLNVMCARCLSKFSICPPLAMAERIDNADDLYTQQGQKAQRLLECYEAGTGIRREDV